MKIKPIFHLTFLLICFSAAVFGQDDQVPSEGRESLIERENSLIAQMSDLDPGLPNYKAELQKLGTELRGIQEKLNTTFGNLQDRVHDPSSPTAESSLIPSSASPAAVSSLSSAAADQAEFSPLDGMDSATLRQLQSQIVYQLKYLNETLKTLNPQDPQDEGLRVSIREEQEKLQIRLEEISKRLGTEPLSKAEEGLAPPLTDQQNELSNQSPAAGLLTLTPSQDLPAADPIEAEGTWYGADNKSAKILSEIAELKKANAETQRQLAEILDELKTIETQLKLLSRQAVADK